MQLLNKLKLEKEKLEATVTIEATLTDKHLVDGKTPSVSFIDKSWRVTGFDGEITQIKEQLGEASAKLEQEKRRYEVLKMVFDMWRTQSANERNAF